MRTLTVLVALVGVLGRCAVISAQTNCVCNGTAIQPNEACCSAESPSQSYDTRTYCCTEFGVQDKYPIANLDTCPNRVQNPDKPPMDNGICDPRFIPDTFPRRGKQRADFTHCCIEHDHCYSTCKHPGNLTDDQYKLVCDNEVLQCMETECRDAFARGGRRFACLAWVQTQITVLNFLPSFVTGYKNGQKYACMCCAGDQPATPCCGNEVMEQGEECDGTDDSACPAQCIPAGQPKQCQCQQVQLEEVSTRSGWTGELLATRRTWSIAGQQFVEVVRYGVMKRICPETGVFLDCPQTWNVWKFVSLPGYFITPGATPPAGAPITVKPENIITEGCEDLDPQRRFSSAPPSCPQTVVADNTFIASTSPSFFFPLCFSTHSCGVYDPASPYMSTTGYTGELQTGCVMEACPAQYDCPLPCVEGNPNYPACLTQGHCPGN